jgi:hypothetical protein
MVVTMSRICGPRARRSAASRAPSPSTRNSALGVRREQVVIEVDHFRAAADDDAPANHAERLAGGGSIEGRRGGRAPVDQQRFTVLVAYAEPADVVCLAVVEIEPAEHEPFGLGVQRPQLFAGVVDHRVAFHEAGARAGGGAPVAIPFEGTRLRPHCFDPFVDSVDDLLLCRDLLRSGVGHLPNLGAARGAKIGIRADSDRVALPI